MTLCKVELCIIYFKRRISHVFSYFALLSEIHESLFLENSTGGGGGGSSIVKVPGDVPPARVCFFKPSSLAKGILFANFSPLSLTKGILFANFRPLSLGKGILFGNFGQRNVKLR